MASKGIIEGISITEFNPSSSITRADFILLLVKTLGLSADYKGNFRDVAPDVYYAEATGITKVLHIAEGDQAGDLHLNQAITRQDLISLLYRALIIKGILKEIGPQTAGMNFADYETVSPYATKPFTILINQGVVQGDGTSLQPTRAVTRAEAAVLLYRVYNMIFNK